MGQYFKIDSVGSAVVVQSLNCVRLFATQWTAAHQTLSFTISWSLLKFMSNEFMMPSNHFISVVLFSSCPQSFPASGSFPVHWLLASSDSSLAQRACVFVLWSTVSSLSSREVSPFGICDSNCIGITCSSCFLEVLPIEDITRFLALAQSNR